MQYGREKGTACQLTRSVSQKLDMFSELRQQDVGLTSALLQTLKYSS